MESVLEVHEYRRGLNARSLDEWPVALTTMLYSGNVFILQVEILLDMLAQKTAETSLQVDMGTKDNQLYNCTVAYTGLVTCYKVPETHGHV